jgi:hypothetical protein
VSKFGHLRWHLVQLSFSRVVAHSSADDRNGEEAVAEEEDCFLGEQVARYQGLLEMTLFGTLNLVWHKLETLIETTSNIKQVVT